MSDAPLRLPDASPVLRVMPMPADANIHGDVFGGWIMANVDVAGAIPAARRANGRVATIAVTSFLFKNPVFVGDLLSFYARVLKTGNTSITVRVQGWVRRRGSPSSHRNARRRGSCFANPAGMRPRCLHPG